MASMHKLWTIPELRDHIVRQIDDKSDCARMARVWEPFWYPSVTKIWNAVPDLEYVWRLFPEETLKLEVYQASAILPISLYPTRDDGSGPSLPTRVNGFKKKLQPSDWDRFNLHAPFIKSIGIKPRSKYASMFEALSKSHDPPESFDIYSILPNLTDLALTVNTDCEDPKGVYKYLFGPKLQSFTIDYPGASAKGEVMLMWLYAYTRQPLFPTLRKLTINIGQLVSPVGAISLGELISGQAELQSLVIETNLAPTSLLLAAATLPNLKELRFGESAVDYTWEEVNLEEGFPCLTKLDVCGDAAGIAKFIPFTNPTHLKDLILRVPHTNSSEFTLDRLAIGIERFVNLTSVRISVRTFAMVSWTVVEPLLGCPNITDFAFIMHFAALRLNDENLLSIANAWPSLEHLVILNGHTSTPTVTLHGLQNLATDSTCLKTLWISVDARQSTPPDMLVNQLPALEDLNLLYSAGGQAEDIARFICKLAPNLTTGRTLWSQSSNTQETNLWRDVWGHVHKEFFRHFCPGPVAGMEAFDDDE